MRYIAAAVQFEPVLGEKRRNIERLTVLVREAASAGANLIVLPEMATTGYRFHSVDEIVPLVEPIPGGPTTAHFERLSGELGIYLVAGFPELDTTTGNRYNTAALLGPDGFVGKYRKIHLYGDDVTWATEGDLGFPVFDTHIGRIALVICMDLVFMESCRVATLAGADVIAAPVNWSGPVVTWWARAFENGTYLVCANRWGEERGAAYCGKSAIISPQGQVLGSFDHGDGIALAEVDTDLAQENRALALARQRPKRYREAVKGALWTTGASTQSGAIRVAAGQGRTPEEMKEQILRAAAAPDQETGSQLDLMVFPFCQEAGGMENIPLLADAAARVGCHVVWGWGDAQGHSNACLLWPDGRVERCISDPLTGNEGELFDLPWGRLGLALGDDLIAPEVVRSLAISGADVIAVAADWPEGSPRWLWAVRWMENETPLVVANRGGSRIWHADRPRPEAGRSSDSVITATVAIGKAREGFCHLRPTWYVGLTEV